MHPSFEQFVAALRDPAQRSGIRLSISDEDASTLLTNADWANDYYSRWIALFPPAALESTTPEFVTASSPFGPPPSAPAMQASPYAAADAPAWVQTTRRRSTSPARVAIIAVLTIVTLAIVAGVINEVAAVTRAPVAAKTPVVTSPTPTPVEALPDDLHGLSAREYPLMEAIFESQDTTIPTRTAQGMTDDQLRAATDGLIPIAETACTQAAKQPNGFDDPGYKSSFVAGYVSTSKVTPEKAGLVYDAIEQYCLNQ